MSKRSTVDEVRVRRRNDFVPGNEPERSPRFDWDCVGRALRRAVSRWCGLAFRTKTHAPPVSLKNAPLASSVADSAVSPSTSRNLQCLATADVCRCVAHEAEIDFELRRLDLRVDLADLEYVDVAADFELGALANAYPIQIELVDQRRRLEAIDVVDLPKAFTARLRFAELRIEGRELAVTWGADEQVVEIGPRQRQVLFELIDRGFRSCSICARRILLVLAPGFPRSRRGAGASTRARLLRPRIRSSR